MPNVFANQQYNLSEEIIQCCPKCDKSPLYKSEALYFCDAEVIEISVQDDVNQPANTSLRPGLSVISFKPKYQQLYFWIIALIDTSSKTTNVCTGSPVIGLTG